MMLTEMSLMDVGKYTPEMGRQLAAYVDYTRAVDHPLKGIEDEATLRGRAIFERTDVGCADCHNGPQYADQNRHDIFGVVDLRTPSLLGVAASPPYFHDGSAATLREVLWTVRGAVEWATHQR